MRRNERIAALTLGVTVALSATVPSIGAQVADTSRAAILASLPRGTMIRVLAGAQSYEGRLASSDARVVTFAPSAGERAPRTVPLQSVDSLWTGKRNTASGALVGATIVGGVAAIGLTAFGAALSNGTHERCNCGSSIAGATVAATVVGGVLGALLGSASTSWQQRVP